MARKTINVDYLARVEGEGGVRITFDGRTVRDVELRIFEPPRFFEAFLRGRAYTEAPDITARICGICPVAYQMSAVHAMEDALGVTVSEPVRELRRLLYCGEWIESHTLHIYMLHAPDFLGYEGAIEMAKDHGDVVRQGLELKKIGNEILELLGGRAIHPVNVRVGGFYRAPSRRELRTLVEPLQRARDIALATVRFVSGFDFPDCERDYEFVVAGCGGRISVQRRPRGFEQGPRHHAARIRRAFRGVACEALQRAALASARAALPDRPDRALQPEFRRCCRRWRAMRRRRRDLARPATIRSAASWSARWRCCTPATRRCASSTHIRSRSSRISI